MGKEIGSEHNNLFQNILGREDMARDFVRYYMPAEIVGDLDLDTLEVVSESYISDDLHMAIEPRLNPDETKEKKVSSQLNKGKEGLTPVK